MRLHNPAITGSLTVSGSSNVDFTSATQGVSGSFRASDIKTALPVDTVSGSAQLAAGISGSWQNVIGSGSLGMVSGSEISTGSFGSLVVSDEVQGDLTIRDSLTVNKGLTVNDNKEAAYDFIVKSQNKNSTLYVDSNKDKVGIGYNSPGGSDLSSSLHIAGDLATDSHITASGNISASGDLYVNHITASGNMTFEAQVGGTSTTLLLKDIDSKIQFVDNQLHYQDYRILTQ